MSKKYGFLTGVIRVDGWIEPDGTFFPCAVWGHDSAAFTIARKLYGEDVRNGTKELERRGWMRCTPPELFCTGNATEQQIATAREVLMFSQNEVVNAKMRRRIKQLERLLYPLPRLVSPPRRRLEVTSG